MSMMSHFGSWTTGTKQPFNAAKVVNVVLEQSVESQRPLVVEERYCSRAWHPISAEEYNM